MRHWSRQCENNDIPLIVGKTAMRVAHKERTIQMERTVLARASGHIEIEVSGDSKEDILQKASEEISDMDFGGLEDIDWSLEIAPWSE